MYLCPSSLSWYTCQQDIHNTINWSIFKDVYINTINTGMCKAFWTSKEWRYRGYLHHVWAVVHQESQTFSTCLQERLPHEIVVQQWNDKQDTDTISEGTNNKRPWNVTCQNIKCSLMMVLTASLLQTSLFKHWQAKSWTFCMFIMSHLFSSCPQSFACSENTV